MDHSGFYKGAMQEQSIGMKVKNTFESEFQVVIMAMQDCWNKQYTKIIIESDCKNVIDILKNITLHF